MGSLSASEIRIQIEKLKAIRTMVCDVPDAYNSITDAIETLQECHNQVTGFKKHYSRKEIENGIPGIGTLKG